MTTKTTIEKILEIIINAYKYRIPEIEKISNAKSNEITFGEIKKRSGFEKNTVSNALTNLKNSGQVISRKDKADKRYTYYSITNESERAKYQIIKTLEESKQIQISKDKIEKVIQLVMNEMVLDFELFDKEKAKIMPYQYVSDIVSEIIKELILESMGFNIIFSSNSNDLFTLLNNNKDELNKFEEKMLRPLIGIGVFFGSIIQSINRNITDPFQVVIRFTPQSIQDTCLHFMNAKDKIFETELIKREILPANFTKSELIDAYNKQKNLIDDIKNYLAIILSKESIGTYLASFILKSSNIEGITFTEMINDE
ncbi:MAG: winged helix-turn-helix transcriptional regulator [Candidatus Heimdallarchaeota archaeon]